MFWYSTIPLELSLLLHDSGFANIPINKLECVIKVMSVRRVSWYADLEGWRILKYLSVVVQFIKSNGIYTFGHTINAFNSQTGHEMSGGEIGNPSHHMQMCSPWPRLDFITYIRPSFISQSMDKLFCQIAFPRWRLRVEVVKTGVTEWIFTYFQCPLVHWLWISL